MIYRNTVTEGKKIACLVCQFIQLIMCCKFHVIFLQHPKFFSCGFFSHEGPTREQVRCLRLSSLSALSALLTPFSIFPCSFTGMMGQDNFGKFLLLLADCHLSRTSVLETQLQSTNRLSSSSQFSVQYLLRWSKVIRDFTGFASLSL